MELYKILIPSRNIRIKLLEFFEFVPDRWMLKMQYFIKFRRKLDFENGRRYTEKIQWYKLYYKHELMRKCVDKFLVREYVRSKGLGEILNIIYGIYNSAEEIEFTNLPNDVVFKDTMGGGGNAVIISNNICEVDKVKLRNKLSIWVKRYIKHDSAKEWVYEHQTHKIIAEKLIKCENEKLGVVDYKFMCFNGKVKYVFVMAERRLGNGMSVNIYDREFNQLDYTWVGCTKISNTLKKPNNYYQMVRYAELLAKDFLHVRVDLYDEFNKIIFGELTFFNASGYVSFNPDCFDFILGEEFIRK